MSADGDNHHYLANKYLVTVKCLKYILNSFPIGSTDECHHSSIAHGFTSISRVCLFVFCFIIVLYDWDMSVSTRTT